MTEPTLIRCRLDGPLIVRGKVRIVDHLGNEIPLPVGKDNVALCRCGHSSIKPFCDGTHRTVGFQADPAAPPPANPS